eukprot:gene25523-34079_t
MGKGGDGPVNKGAENVQSGSGEAKKEVYIDGRYYDVTNMRHPGGSVINFYSGKEIDASEAFMNFHIRSKKAKKLLASLPSRESSVPITDSSGVAGQTELMADFNALIRQFEKEGLFNPDIKHVIYRMVEILVIFALGFYCLSRGQLLLFAILLGIGEGRCGWFMHEGGHYSLTGIISVDRIIQTVFYGVGCGMSAGWWRVNHNKHHSTPQKLGYDVDLDTLPLVAFTDKVVKRIGFPMKLWIRLQSFLFPVVTTSLVALGWQFYLHPRYIVRSKKYSEMAAFAARFLIWTALVTAEVGLTQSILLYLAVNWFGANYIFLNFAVSHTHLDVVAKDDTTTDWVRYAAIYTMNVSPGPLRIVDWWMAYLNFQIEHHLFPSMPQFRHPTISPRVKQLLEKHGLPYQRRSYVDAMYVTFQNLHRVGGEVFLG